jgi:hypothetical protein
LLQRLYEAIAWRVDRLPEHPLADAVVAAWSYRERRGAWPNLVRPRRFNERLLRMMVTDEGRSPLRARISDKELVKQFIRERVGDRYNVATFAVLRSEADVRGYAFPDDCVVKPTHASGLVEFRQGGVPEVDRDALIRWLRINYYREYREPNYRSLEPKIIVEELLREDGQRIPRDYKVFCFHGVPGFVMVNEGRFASLHKTLDSPQWELLPFRLDCPQHDIPRPPNLDEMLDVSRRLAAGLSFVRVDLFSPGNDLRVGELTNFPDACGVPFDTPRSDEAAGRFFDEPHLPARQVFGRQGEARR